MTFRSDLDALEARHAALDAEVAQKTTERDRTAALLADAQARARLPVLDNIRIASPCKASWDDMVGDDVRRHCKQCDKDVFNLSSMTREEAEALITATAGNLCARYYRRADGTIMTADCAVGARRSRRIKLVAAGALAVAAGAGALAYAEMTNTIAPMEQAQGGVELGPTPVETSNPLPLLDPVPVINPPPVMGGASFELPPPPVHVAPVHVDKADAPNHPVHPSHAKPPARPAR